MSHADVLKSMLDAEGVLTQLERNAVEAALEELRPTAQYCSSCNGTLAHFAGPGYGESGLICQNLGCDRFDVELEVVSA